MGWTGEGLPLCTYNHHQRTPLMIQFKTIMAAEQYGRTIYKG